jgi:hypothetical protein
MKRCAAISVLLLGLFLPLGFMHAGPLRIALLADTTIQGDAILLSHLLPSNIPIELRRRAQNISLGRAPEVGSVRSLSRESLQAALEETGLDPAEFVIPERVAVRREAHLLSMERVWPALRAAAASRGIALPANIRSQDLQWSAPLGLPADDSQLEVQGVYIDKLLNQARFRLRFPNNPAAPSFYAWCPLPRTQQPPFAENTPERSSRSSMRGLSSATELVSIRRLATLHLHSENSSAMLQVRPLQSGELGQTVRVRLPANGHTLFARIAGPNLLDAVF